MRVEPSESTERNCENKQGQTLVLQHLTLALQDVTLVLHEPTFIFKVQPALVFQDSKASNDTGTVLDRYAA